MLRRPWGRGWAIVWAVLQLALPTAVAHADVLVERESRSQVAHVEATSDATCRPLHAAECALCQVLSQAVAPTEHAPVPAILAEVRCPPASDSAARACGAAGQRPPARAPPLA